MLEKNAKIFVAGHRGLVGSAIWNNLQQRGYTNLSGTPHTLNLVDKLFSAITSDTILPSPP